MAKFYDKNELFKKVSKFYDSGKLFQNFIEEGELFPLTIKLKKLNQKDIQNSYSTVLNELQSLKKENIALEYKEFHFKNIGVQTLPVALCFETSDALLDYIEKEEEFRNFKELYTIIVTKYPLFRDKILEKPFLVLEYAPHWEKLFLIYNFFLQNPQPNRYIRELSIDSVDTKFIERYKKIIDTFLVLLLDKKDFKEDISSLSNYGFEKKYSLRYPQPLVRFRILDREQYIFGMSDISLPIEEFKNITLDVKNIYIVENKITTLSFPFIKDSAVIFGSGYGVEVLKNVEWLRNKNIFYWGDIDRDGFAILSQIRGYFPQIISLFMDKKTVERFDRYSIEVENSKITKKRLDNLTQDEEEFYDSLEDSYRLEQERLDFEYIKEELVL